MSAIQTMKASLLALAMLVAACPEVPGGNDGGDDAGPIRSDGGIDAGDSSDSGLDASTAAPDGGSLEPDGGSPEPDGGLDAGQPDAGAIELDAGAPDDGGTLAVGPLGNRVIAPGVTLPPIPLIITHSASAAPSVSVTGESIGLPSPITLPAQGLQVTGSGLDRALVLGPFSMNLAASYTVLVRVDDGMTLAETIFVLRVNAVPSIDLIPDTATVVGFPIPSFLVGAYDDSPDPTTLVLTRQSSNLSFLPVDGITLGPIIGGNGGRGTFSVALSPSTTVEGSSDVTLRVTDAEGLSSSQTFRVKLTLTAANGVELISHTSAVPPASGNGLSMDPAVSGDGGLVVFTSTASDLAGGETSAGDLFIRDRAGGGMVRLGLPGRSGGAAITPDGRFIAFVTLANLDGSTDAGQTPMAQVYVYDLRTASFDRVSQSSAGASANGPSSTDSSAGGGVFRKPGISADGRYVVFESEATNLVPGDTNGLADVFVRDRSLATTTRVSVSSSGAQSDGPSSDVAISGDGQVIAFASTAKNLVDGQVEADTRWDVFVRSGGVTTRASSNPGGTPGNGASAEPALDGDGRLLVFSSGATDLMATIDTYGKVDIYLVNLSSGAKVRLNLDLDPQAAQGHCSMPSISADGRRVAFRSAGTFPGYVNGLLNAYVLDLPSTTFTFIGPSLALGAPNGGTGYGLSVAAGGDFVVFQSPASNLFPNDLNGAIDVFIQSVP